VVPPCSKSGKITVRIVIRSCPVKCDTGIIRHYRVSWFESIENYVMYIARIYHQIANLSSSSGSVCHEIKINMMAVCVGLYVTVEACFPKHMNVLIALECSRNLEKIVGCFEYIHNLVCIQRICSVCEASDDWSVYCVQCGKIKHVFWGGP
jgi:hypothetical protein